MVRCSGMTENIALIRIVFLRPGMKLQARAVGKGDILQVGLSHSPGGGDIVAYGSLTLEDDSEVGVAVMDILPTPVL